jgi:hypothetical protein
MSHAIPDAVFKSALRVDSGKLVLLDSNPNTSNKYTSDSCAVYLLCKECESRLNNEYDSYAINLLKNTSNVNKNDYGLTFKNLDRRKLRLFFLSVLWRSALSNHEFYKGVKLDFVQIEKLRNAFFYGSNIPYSDFTVAIYKLKTFTNITGLNSENIATFIFTPFTRRHPELNPKSVCYIFSGFLIEISFGSLAKKIMTKAGVLYGNNRIFMAPFYEITDSLEFMHTTGIAMEKSDSGKSKI